MCENIDAVEKRNLECPTFTAPENKVQRDCHEDEVLTVEFDLITFPKVMQGAHGSGSSANARRCIIVVLQIIGDKRPKAFEKLSECYESICDMDFLSKFTFITLIVFTFLSDSWRFSFCFRSKDVIGMVR